MIKVLETITDSIAIEILNGNSVLIGKGNELHLFTRAKDNSVVEQKKLGIKLNNKIHGIQKGHFGEHNLLLLHGEKEFVLCSYNESNNEFHEFYRAELTDWISCGQFLNEQNEFVLLTAHSIILRFQYDVAKGKCSLKQRVSCSDKSTLYCAHIHGCKWNDLVVFAGNAFGELLIWKPSEYAEAECGEPSKCLISPLIQRVAAHNGVIFSIDYDEQTQHVITTSDDRAVKWWKLNIPSKNDWQDVTFVPLASGYGHIARVFRGRIIKHGKASNQKLYALSVGEDSYICLWLNNGELVFKRRQQYGATIWNFAYDSISETIYTVGSTGNLVAYDLKSVLEQQQHNTVCLSPIGKESEEYIAKVKFLAENELLAVTNHNRLMRMAKDKGFTELSKWSSIDLNLNMKCTVFEVFENRIALCGFKRVMLLEYFPECSEYKCIYDQKHLSGVIRTFVFFSRCEYLLSDDQGNCLLLSLKPNSMSEEKSFKLPKGKEPWITTALRLNEGLHILVSNRQGNILLYKQNEKEEQQNDYQLKDIVKHPHGNLGATSFRIHSTTNSSSSVLVYSTGHDGALNLYRINLENSSMLACKREIVPISWIEQTVSCNAGKLKLLHLGFNDNHFVVWSKDYDFLLQLPCGGGHRCWHFCLDKENKKIYLVFIRNKRVHYHFHELKNASLMMYPLANKWHNSPCNIMEILNDSIAISAGDDNLIKIHEITDQSGMLLKSELHNHISNVRTLKCIALKEVPAINEYLIVSGGGRAQLCITKFNKQTFQTEQLINYTLQKETKGNGKPIPLKETTFNCDPETRIMSLDVLRKDVKDLVLYSIYLGCSDGFVRHLEFNYTTLEIKNINEYFYNKCILQIRLVLQFNYVLVAATDGILRFLNLELNQTIHQLKHHASGVNALSICYQSKEKLLKILTGGDDQAVSFTELSLINFKVLREFQLSHLHSAQVCASAITQNGQYGFTSGVDQNLYKLDLTLSGEVMAKFHSCVADIKGVELLNNDKCLLYGCGLQICSFSK